MDARPPCRFGCAETACIRVELSDGCVAFPGDRQQDLCLHHAMRAEPRRFIEMVAFLAPSPFEATVLRQRYRP